MNIHRNNYEEYFLDYLEGRLQGPLLEQFRQFLQDNPDIAAEAEGLEHARLMPESTLPPDIKQGLKKKITPVGEVDADTVEMMLAAAMDGDLDKPQEDDLERFLQLNPAYRQEQGLFAATRLVPDMQVTYPTKAGLRHRPLPIAIRLTWAATAAAALILLVLGWRILLLPEAPGPVLPVIIPESYRPSAPAPAVNAPAETNVTPGLPATQPSIQKPAPVKPRSQPSMPSRIEIKDITRLDPGARHRLSQPFKYPGQSIVFFDPFPLEEEPSSGMLARVFRNFGAKAKEKGQEIIDLNLEPDDRFNFWDLADLGVQGYNKLADREVELNKVENASGQAKQYTFSESGRVLLSKSVDQP